MEKLFEIASSISTPLGIGGFFAAVVFYVFRQIVAKNIFPKLNAVLGADLLKLIIERLFVLALVAMILGFVAYLVGRLVPQPGTPSSAAQREVAVVTCIEQRTQALQTTEAFSQEGSVRCEGGGAFGNGQSKNGSVTFQAPPNFHVVGTAVVTDLGRNNGNYGAVSYDRDTSGSVTRVSVPIHCSSPNKVGGPGAWMTVRLSGRVASVLTAEARQDIERTCRSTMGG